MRYLIFAFVALIRKIASGVFTHNVRTATHTTLATGMLAGVAGRTGATVERAAPNYAGSCAPQSGNKLVINFTPQRRIEIITISPILMPLSPQIGLFYPLRS